MIWISRLRAKRALVNAHTAASRCYLNILRLVRDQIHARCPTVLSLLWLIDKTVYFRILTVIFHSLPVDVILYFILAYPKMIIQL